MEIIITYILDYLCSEKQPDVKHHQLAKTKPLPSMDSLGPPPAKPPKPPAVNLQAFQRQAGVPKTHKEGKEMHGAPHAASQPAGVTAPAPVSPSHLPLCFSSQVTILNCFHMGLDIHHCLFSHGGHGSLPVKWQICGTWPLIAAEPAGFPWEHCIWSLGICPRGRKRKEQGREAESFCVSYKACVVNRSGAVEEGEGVKREEVGVNLACNTRGSLRALWSAFS